MTDNLADENRRLRRAVEELTILNEISNAISATMDVRELSDLIVNKCLKHTRAEQGAIWLLDATEQGVSAKTFLRVMESDILNIPFKVGASLAGYVLKNRHPLIVNDLATDVRFDGITGQYRQIRNLLAVPLSLKSKIVGVLSIFNKTDGSDFDTDDSRLLSIIASQSAQSIENARLYTEELRLHKLDEELQAARRIQYSLLPQSNPEVPGLDVAGLSIPAQEVGGDYYDFIEISKNQLALAVADVSGKGMPAALLMASMQACVRGQSALGKAPHETMGRINFMLHKNIESGRFITALYGIMDCRNRIFRYVNAGHNYPIVVGADGSVRTEEWSDMLLGVFAEVHYREGQIVLNPGDMLFMYTDGVTEATNEEGKFFGTQRLTTILKDSRELSAEDISRLVLQSVITFQGASPRSDDITLAVVKAL